MELLVVIVIAFVLSMLNAVEEVNEYVLSDREVKLNPDFYEDENAFMEVANALGFGIPRSSTSSTDMGMRTESVHVVPSNSENNVRDASNGNGGSDENSNRVRNSRTRVMDRLARTPR